MFQLFNNNFWTVHFVTNVWNKIRDGFFVFGMYVGHSFATAEKVII